MVTEVAAAVQQVENILANIDSKIDSQPQHSPGSQSGSAKSEDSGIEEVRKTSTAAKTLSRRSSRMSQSAMSPVLEQLEHMIVSDEWVGKDEGPTFSPSAAKPRAKEQRLSDLGRTLVTTSSLKSYIDLLTSQHRQSIAAWLYGNTCQALGQQFRYPDCQVYCSEPEATLALSVKNGIGHAVRLAIRAAYGDEYATKGWRAFSEKGTPVVYVSPAHHQDLSPYLASEFGIADVVVLPKLEGELSEIEGRIDHLAFEKILDEDLAAGKIPLMLIGVVGSTTLGQNDMISKILEIRKNKYKFWLHIVGQAMAALTLREPTEVLVHVLSQVDSVTLPLALWLGIPAAPVLTFYRPVEGHKPTYREKLGSLPWWVTTQYLGSKGITDCVENAYLLSKLMLKGLSNVSGVELIGIDNAAEFATQVYKNKYTAPTVIVFRYKYQAAKNAVKAYKELVQKPEEEREDAAVQEAERVMNEELEYVDSLNHWLGQGLLSECQSLGIHLVDLGAHYGTAFRFCPLDHAAALRSDADHVQRFVKQLSDILRIVDSTVAARARVPHIIAETFPSLTLLSIKRWAGVGAVCYVPTIVKEVAPQEWNDNQKQQISHLNLELVHQLRAFDTAFSSGESANYGVSCVKFGMLSDEKDLIDLMQMVANKGKEIENSQQYLDSLAEIIRHGIEAANEDLRKENDLRLQNEGVMRQLPIMGSLVNWFAPLDKDQLAVRGRSFNLKTGEIQATDTLYKLRRGEDVKTPMTPIATPQTPHDFSKMPTQEVLEEEGDAEAEETEKLAEEASPQ